MGGFTRSTLRVTKEGAVRVPAAPTVVSEHLAGTKFDHDQSSHAGVGRGFNAKKVRESVERIARDISGESVEYAYILNGQGEVVLVQKGDETSIEFEIKDLRKLRNGIFIHNHPGNIPASFSFTDFITASVNDVREIHAVSRAGGKTVMFSMYRTTDEGWPSSFEGKKDFFQDLIDAGFPSKSPKPGIGKPGRRKRLASGHKAWETVVSRGYYNNHSGVWEGKFTYDEAGKAQFLIPDTVSFGIRYEMREL